MNKHEEIAKTLNARLSELQRHLSKVDSELHKRLSADFEDQAIELENQEALEVIERSDIREIRQIQAALKADSRRHVRRLRQMRTIDRPQAPQGVADSDYVHFMLCLM